jgi:hypothetical protein
MPGSTLSGTASHSSGGSKRVRARRYYKTASSSHIDESLFGFTRNGQVAGTTLEQEAEERVERRRSGNQNGSMMVRKNTVQVITKDLIRNVIIPQEDPSGQSLVISAADFERIKNAARITPEYERQAMIDRLKEEKERALNELQERKNYMKMQDLQRHKNARLNDLEEEERIKGEALRQNAIEQLQEQEDEIKRLNELILNAKCHVIRDTQLLEKDMIKRELLDEEKRLDELMEVDRVNALRMEEEIERKRKEERLVGAMKIMEQIEENEKERLLELEQKDQENQMMKKYLNKLCEEEAEKIEKRRQEQSLLRNELNTCNAEILRRKELAKEQEKLIEQRVIQFQQEKAEREAAYEKEQEQIKIEKEREVARLRALQERAHDEQAERDALRAHRAQEQAEREWRRKEAEEARRRAETEAMLIEARAQQMAQKEHFLAVQAQRERADFERVLRAQQELTEKQKQEEEEMRRRRSKFSDEVRAQIREKEQTRINERNKYFEEGIKLDEEARQRQLKLEEVKKKKLQELRAAGIHEKYLAQIERKINQSHHIAT